MAGALETAAYRAAARDRSVRGTDKSRARGSESVDGRQLALDRGAVRQRAAPGGGRVNHVPTPGDARQGAQPDQPGHGAADLVRVDAEVLDQPHDWR